MPEETQLAVREEREIQYQTPEGERFNIEQRMAKLFVASGLFNDIKGSTERQAIAQAYVKIALGSSMGFTPAESMSGIDIIQGRPTVGAQLRAARMQRNGFSWKIEQCDIKGCRLKIFQGQTFLGECSYMEEDAKSAGLLGKDNWKKDPTSMYFARAVTRAQRRYAPGVLSLDMQSPEEIIDVQVDERPQIAQATDGKTEELAEKLKQRRSASQDKTPTQEGGKRVLSQGQKTAANEAEEAGTNVKSGPPPAAAEQAAPPAADAGKQDDLF